MYDDLKEYTKKSRRHKGQRSKHLLYSNVEKTLDRPHRRKKRSSRRHSKKYQMQGRKHANSKLLDPQPLPQRSQNFNLRLSTPPTRRQIHFPQKEGSPFSPYFRPNRVMPPVPPSPRSHQQAIEHRARIEDPNKNAIERQEQETEMFEHIKKIRNFLKRLIRREIIKSQQVFDSIKGLLPTNSTRHSFDANPEKCRYLDIICVDQDRVLLNSASNFIHANRVPIGDDGKNEIIVTQLPLRHTVMDFWHMIWDSNVQSILAILTDSEWNNFGQRIKLLPNWKGCLHQSEGLCIAYQQEVAISNTWTVTFYGLSWSGIHRTIQWIRYNDWGHNKAPRETKSIWEINSYLRHVRKPIVCMSMSGAGRAGSYAVLELAHERLHNKKVKKVTMSECLKKVRDSRMHAMQSRAQFNFVQIALADHLLASENVRNDMKESMSRYKKLRYMEFNGLTKGSPISSILTTNRS